MESARFNTFALRFARVTSRIALPVKQDPGQRRLSKSVEPALPQFLGGKAENLF